MDALAKSGNPADVAREAIRQMAASRVAPTPENFTRAYRSASGSSSTATCDDTEAGQIVGQLLQEIVARRPDLTSALKLQEYVNGGDWKDALKIVGDVIGEALTEQSREWPRLTHRLLLQLDTTHAEWTRARKLGAVTHVLTTPSSDIRTREKLERLVAGWTGKPDLASTMHSIQSVESALIEKVVHHQPGKPGETLRVDPAPVIAHRSAEVNAWRTLALTALDFTSSEEYREVSKARDDREGTLKSRVAGCNGIPGADLLCELEAACSENHLKVQRQAALRDRLVKLLLVVCENLTLFADDDAWVNGQVTRITQLLNAPIDEQAIAEAEESLERAVLRQAELKADLTAAKAAVKDMLRSLIERLAMATASTGEFHQRISVRAEAIRHADDLPSLSLVVANLLDDTIEMRDRIQKTHDELSNAHRIAAEAETRVKALERELVDVSNLVRMDPLTQVLNRRGLAESFATQRARAEREGKPLALALLDIDNFKSLNDSLGHQAGDMALKYVSRMIRAAVRPADTVARYGGEEFAILLEDTSVDGAEIILKRLQRQLTRAIFLHNNEKVLITFSAGITKIANGDTQDSAVNRADIALYAAKAAGKNCVHIG